jgi:signal peptidase I
METNGTAHRGVRLQSIFTTFEIPAASMEPTLPKGMAAVEDRFYYAQHPLERWHVVAFSVSHKELAGLPTEVTFRDDHGHERTLGRPHFPFVSRVVGLPGETVRFDDSGIQCDGQPLMIPRELAPMYKGFPDAKRYKYGSSEYAIPDDAVFVLSDNVATGIDSRQTGPILLRCISARVLGVVQAGPILI